MTAALQYLSLLMLAWVVGYAFGFVIKVFKRMSELI